jgi:hypothetical protein
MSRGLSIRDLNRALPSRPGSCAKFVTWVRGCIAGSSNRPIELSRELGWSRCGHSPNRSNHGVLISYAGYLGYGTPTPLILIPNPEDFIFVPSGCQNFSMPCIAAFPFPLAIAAYLSSCVAAFPFPLATTASPFPRAVMVFSLLVMVVEVECIVVPPPFQSPTQASSL